MKNSILLSIVGGFIALYFAAVSTWAQNPKPDAPVTAPQAWRHLALEHDGGSVLGAPDLARKIDALGEEGWQLVDVESVVQAGTTTKIIFFFKRPK